MSTKHTAEPWFVFTRKDRVVEHIVCAPAPVEGQPFLGEVPLTGTCLKHEANLRRAVTCVNACEGIDDPEAAIKAARRLANLVLEWRTNGKPDLDAFMCAEEDFFKALG